jgi:hypothetical protein
LLLQQESRRYLFPLQVQDFAIFNQITIIHTYIHELTMPVFVFWVLMPRGQINSTILNIPSPLSVALKPEE